MTVILCKQCAIWVLAMQLFVEQVLDLILIPVVLLVRLTLPNLFKLSYCAASRIIIFIVKVKLLFILFCFLYFIYQNLRTLRARLLL